MYKRYLREDIVPGTTFYTDDSGYPCVAVVSDYLPETEGRLWHVFCQDGSLRSLPASEIVSVQVIGPC